MPGRDGVEASFDVELEQLLVVGSGWRLLGVALAEELVLEKAP
jgi:hypothetical protein